MWGIFRRRKAGNTTGTNEAGQSDLKTPSIADLFAKHILLANEELKELEEPEGLTKISTSLRRQFSIRSERDSWIVGRETWVRDFVLATREDIRVHGTPERFGFILPTAGGELFVNDNRVISELGTRLYDGMDPFGYAELLVQFHPYTSARRDVLREKDDLRRAFNLSHLPDVTPFRTERTTQGITIHFTACTRYRPPGSMPMMDLQEWIVTVPQGGPARWEAPITVEGIPLVEQR